MSDELTDEEIREAYTKASKGSYLATHVMAGYRAIIAAALKRDALKAELEAVKPALVDLVKQVEEFAAKYGEADFETWTANKALGRPVPKFIKSLDAAMQSGKSAERVSMTVEPDPIEIEAKRLYAHYSGNHPTIHGNRFPTWDELKAEDKKEWLYKAMQGGK